MDSLPYQYEELDVKTEKEKLAYFTETRINNTEFSRV